MRHKHLATILLSTAALMSLMLTIGCRKQSTPTPTPRPASPLSPLPSPTKAQPQATLAFTDRDDVILFISDRDGPQAHFIMDPDGSNVERLDFPQLSGILLERPQWVPDLGLFLAEVRIGDAEDFFFFDTAGNLVENLTNSPEESELGPILAPGTDLVAYTCASWDLDICVVRRDGTGRANLTAHPARDSEPAWHPGGENLAFVSNRGGIPDIYLMNSEGEDPTNLTSTNQADTAPSWSPDGEKILFQSQRAGNWDIYVMDGDGQNPTQLTSDPARDTEPTWSPDGELVGFLSDRSGSNQLYVYEIGNTNLTELTKDPAGQVLSFAWSPDSQRLVYTLAKGDTTRLERINADGSDRVELTDGTTNDAAPFWFAFNP